jgi:hypothetical protein
MLGIDLVNITLEFYQILADDSVFLLKIIFLSTLVIKFGTNVILLDGKLIEINEKQ